MATERTASAGWNKLKWGTTILAISLMVSIITGCGGKDISDKKISENNEASIPSTTNKGAEFMPNELSAAMLNGQYEAIYSRFSQTFKSQISESDFTAVATDFTADVNSFEQFSHLHLNGADEWIWLSSTGDKGLSAVFDAQEEIIGLQILELSSFPETDDVLSQTEYSLPFKGEWLVYWGGKNVFANYHYAHESQRYAYDFIQSKNGFSYEGDPSKNESYFAYGQDIYAPADGTVVTVVNDIADNEPVGVMNEKDPTGNVVIIDHGGEYSILAHLKRGSVTVNAGDKVQRGELIGQLGNSGNSSEAHLHFQISDGQDLFTSNSININWENEINAVRGQTVTAD